MGTEALTYHERKALGHGTLTERLGKDAQGDYYDCALTLKQAVNPVVTKEGYLFSKEAILEYFLNQKKDKKRQLAEWERDQDRRKQQVAEQAVLRHEADITAFERQNLAAASDRTTGAILSAAERQAQQLTERSQTEASGFNIKANEVRARSVKSFWQPQDTPDSDAQMAKPDMDVMCPVSGKKLRLKDLTEVKFTPVPDGTDGPYMDPISQDVFRNSHDLVVLKPTGDVVLAKTYKTCIKPEGMHNGHKIKDSDVIKLVGGGTGFAGKEGQKLQSKKQYTLGPGSGRADLRGQAGGGASRFGLSFQN